MSFGVGLGDIFQVLHVVKITYDAWKDAPEKYKAITQRLRSLQGPLQHLATYYKHSHSVSRTARIARSQRDLDDILSTIDNTLQHLTRILDKRSGLKFWDRLRLSAHEINDLSAALDRHILDLTCYSSSLGLQNDREIQHSQQTLQRGQDELLRLVSQLLPPKVPQTTIEAVAESVDSVSMSSSFMTDYEDDDPAVWRAFRRRAIAEGVTSRDLQLYQAPLHDILRTVAADRHRTRRPRRRPSNPEEQAKADALSTLSSRYADENLHYTYSPTPEEQLPLYLSAEPRKSRDVVSFEEWREQSLRRSHNSDVVQDRLDLERPQRRRRQRSRSVETRIEACCSGVRPSLGECAGYVAMYRWV